MELIFGLLMIGRSHFWNSSPVLILFVVLKLTLVFPHIMAEMSALLRPKALKFLFVIVFNKDDSGLLSFIQCIKNHLRVDLNSYNRNKFYSSGINALKVVKFFSAAAWCLNKQEISP